MSAFAVVVALALGGVDSLAPVSLGGLSLKGPSSWSKSQPDENSLSWNEPDSGASMAVSVFPVDPVRPAKACVGQLVDALGKDGFSATNLGAEPASKKVTTDYLGEEGDEKTDANRVTTTTVVGCNGRIKWVLTWTAKTAQGARFGPMIKRVLESISYGK